MNTDIPGNVGVQLLLDNPFWGGLFQRLPRKTTEKVEQLSLVVDQDGLYLGFHPSVAAEIHKPALLTYVQHELLHFLLDHPRQRNLYSEKRLFDLAADLCVSQFIDPAEDGVQWTVFPFLQMPPFQSADFYYQQFQKILEEPGNSENQIVTKALKENARFLEKHDNWASESAVSQKESTWTLLFDPKELLKNTQPGWPEGLYALVRQTYSHHTASLNWQDQLQWLDRTSRHTRVSFRKNKRSKRYGQPPGIKISTHHRLLLAIDTSGSVSTDQLQLFFREIHRLYRQGAEIDVLECDAAIQRRYPYKGDRPDRIKGRGATHYNPAIEWFNEHTEYGGMVYFTDGRGPAPFVPANRPMLWVLVGLSQKERAKYQQWPGKKAFL